MGDKQKWEFNSDAPLIGVYGNVSEVGIEKLGFITLDVQCQIALDAVVDPIEDGGNDTEEEVKEVDNLEEDEEEEAETESPENEGNAGEEATANEEVAENEEGE